MLKLVKSQTSGYDILSKKSRKIISIFVVMVLLLISASSVIYSSESAKADPIDEGGAECCRG